MISLPGPRLPPPAPLWPSWARPSTGHVGTRQGSPHSTAFHTSTASLSPTSHISPSFLRESNAGGDQGPSCTCVVFPGLQTYLCGKGVPKKVPSKPTKSPSFYTGKTQAWMHGKLVSPIVSTPHQYPWTAFQMYRMSVSTRLGGIYPKHQVICL